MGRVVSRKSERKSGREKPLGDEKTNGSGTVRNRVRKTTFFARLSFILS